MLDWDDPIAAFKRPAGDTQISDDASHDTMASIPPEVIANTLAQVVNKTAASSAPAMTTTASATTTLEAPVPAASTTTVAARAKALLAESAVANADSIAPVRAKDKRVITGVADVNQLAPFRYPWAWDYFLNANKNHWTPLDISMAQDVHDYNHKLTTEERHLYTNVLAYLTTSDVLAMRNIGLAVMEKMRAPELQIYQARQVYEEALHTWTYQHCIESLGLDQGEIYNRYRVVPAINAKIRLANRRIDAMLQPHIDLNNKDEQHRFVLGYMFFAGIFEGCWFYNGFTPIFALQRRGLMKGTAELLQYIMRDEVLHAAFGIRVINQIIKEENLTLDKQALRDMWDESEAAEMAYAQYILNDPILGYSAAEHMEQFRFIANRRARKLHIDEPFPGAKNVLPWLDEQANMRKEKNFFETRVTEYQTGGALSWD